MTPISTDLQDRTADTRGFAQLSVIFRGNEVSLLPVAFGEGSIHGRVAMMSSFPSKRHRQLVSSIRTTTLCCCMPKVSSHHSVSSPITSTVSTLLLPLHFTIIMSEATYHTTRQDLRKDEARVAGQNRGNPPANSDVSQMKVSQLPAPRSKQQFH